MNFYRKLLILSHCVFFSCERQLTIAKCENLVEERWNRKDVLQNELPIGKNYDKVSLVIDVYYGDEVQYQNIFLHVKLSDVEGNTIFEKKDLLLMLFDATTGVPLGRKIFRKQHLEFLVEEGFEIKKGVYKIEISQMTRAENLYGIKKIETKFFIS